MRQCTLEEDKGVVRAAVKREDRAMKTTKELIKHTFLRTLTKIKNTYGKARTASDGIQEERRQE